MATPSRNIALRALGAPTPRTIQDFLVKAILSYLHINYKNLEAEKAKIAADVQASTPEPEPEKLTWGAFDEG